MLNMIDIQSIIAIVLSLVVHNVIYVVKVVLQKRKPRAGYSGKQLLIKLAFSFCITCILSITLLPILGMNMGSIEPTVNFIPFRFIRDFAVGLSYTVDKGLTIRLFIVNTLGNIAIFVPFGVLYALNNKKDASVMSCTVAALLLSACIELVQYIESYAHIVMARASDIDDIILNVLGAIIGLLITRIIIFCARRKSKPHI